MVNDIESEKTQSFVDPTAIIDWNTVKLGKGCYIGPYCVLRNCELRDNVRLEAHCCIGGDPEIVGRSVENHGVLICSGVHMREFVTVHGGSKRTTIICCWAQLFRHSHVAHDCVVGEKAIVSGGASMCGHSVLSSHATLSAHAVLHQFVVVGSGAFIGAGCVVVRHVLPLDKVMARGGASVGINVAKQHLVDVQMATLDLYAAMERMDPTDATGKDAKIL